MLDAKFLDSFYQAGEVGFEPTGVLPPLVFKTSAFVRSAIPPCADYTIFGRRMVDGRYSKTRAAMTLRSEGEIPWARQTWAASESRAWISGRLR
jgi:hypothetical protein